MIVVDASAILDVLLDLEPHAIALRERFRAEATGLLTVHLLDAEVGQVLRRYVRRDEISSSRARAALDDLRSLPLRRYDHGPLLDRAFELHENATFYDALYITLAEGTAAPLLTRDRALATVPGHTATVEVIA